MLLLLAHWPRWVERAMQDLVSTYLSRLILYFLSLHFPGSIPMGVPCLHPSEKTFTHVPSSLLKFSILQSSFSSVLFILSTTAQQQFFRSLFFDRLFDDVCCLVAKSCPTLSAIPQTTAHQAPLVQARILEWVCHFLLRGIFPTQGLNLHLLYCRRSPALQSDS